MSEQANTAIVNWQKIISEANWAKGREIVASGLTDKEFVVVAGFVTEQHVNRLRRTFVRFLGSKHEFPELGWSHFFSALDWEDGLDWLRQANDHEWTVARMRAAKWEKDTGGFLV